jgi:hypothetical protein
VAGIEEAVEKRVREIEVEMRAEYEDKLKE